MGARNVVVISHQLWQRRFGANGGIIGLVREGDMIDIDIPNRIISLRVDDKELANRRAERS